MLVLILLLLSCAVGPLVFILYNNAKSVQTRLGSGNVQTRWTQRFNLLVGALSIVPTFLRVYVLGVTDTITTVLWRRGVSGTILYKDAVDELIRSCDKKDRIALVTGGDSGIGFEIVKGLLKAGYRVIIASRSREMAESAKKELNAGKELSYILVDLASFKSVNAFVNNVQENIPKGSIDILINNAGVMNVPCRITEDNIESQIQINCLSPLLLTLMLLPWINNKRGRILFASSSTLFASSKVEFSLAGRRYIVDGLTHYAHSKRLVALLTRCLQDHLDKYHVNIKAFCYHPGAVRTKLFAHTTVFTLPWLKALFDFIMLTPSEGSLTPLYLCLAPMRDLVKHGGKYFSDTVPQHIPHTTPCSEPDDVHKSLWLHALKLCQLGETDAATLISTCQS
ncbi:NAD(P)-binding protein [Lichtheimia hyalospora FSU 10163]|nr:NAD(P)-binding protein [Lichtheimia hyalospora FSU 10163]